MGEAMTPFFQHAARLLRRLPRFSAGFSFEAINRELTTFAASAHLSSDLGGSLACNFFRFILAVTELNGSFAS